MNNSYSGSTVCYTGYNKLDFSKTSFVRRANELGSPDLILVCGGTNDGWAKSPIGDYKYADWTESYDKDDPAKFSRSWFAWANTLSAN